MLRNFRYNPFDPTLVNDRRRCERALGRYKFACSIPSSMDAEGARAMLWKVFDPSRDTTHKFDTPPRERGTLGDGVRIEAPFTCTYGYNLKLGDSVYIGKGAQIDDSGKVEIGAGTWIGPHVTMLTAECPLDLIDRKGAAATSFTRNITIGSEVVIGNNALIFPGVYLPKGSTVQAGAIVKTSLATVQLHGAPAGIREFAT